MVTLTGVGLWAKETLALTGINDLENKKEADKPRKRQTRKTCNNAMLPFAQLHIKGASMKDLRLRTQSCTAKTPSKKSSSTECDDIYDTGCGPAASVHIETA